MAAPKGKVLSKAKKPFRGAKASRMLRTRKMISPRCEEHFPQDGSYAKKKPWWDYCISQGHNPYIHTREEVHRRPIVEEVDGRKLIKGYEEEVELFEDYNWEQVTDEVSYASGRAVQDSLERGWKFPEEFGFARFCDYRDCGEQNPKFRGPDGGLYHARDEAAVMTLRADETAIFVPSEQKARKAQLAEVNVETL